MASVTQDLSVTRRERCGVVRKGNKPCGHPAGWGVPGVSSGPCKKHGGKLPMLHLAVVNRELLADARAWATDHDVSPADLMLAHVRASAAHAALLERKLNGFQEEKGEESTDPELIPWHRMLDLARRTASDTASKAISLGLEERRQQWVEKIGGWMSMGMEAGWSNLKAHVQKEYGVELTASDRDALFEPTLSRIEVLEGQAEELPGLGEGK
jgi:hypothetical protein